MKNRRTLYIGIVAGMVAASLAAAGPKTVTVDCTTGKTIAKALAKKGDPLTIQISGICVENVIVRRDNVHFVGTSPATDGIEAASASEPFGAAVIVREARNVTFENLQFSGGATSGLRAENARRNIEASNCLFQDNGTYGVIAVGSVIDVTDSSITNNAFGGIAVGESGQVFCGSCSILDNPDITTGTALSARTGGIISLENTVVAGVRSAAAASDSAQLVITGSELTGDAIAIGATDHASIVVDTTTLAGRISASNKSRVQLFDVIQSSSPFPNFINSDSYLEVFSDSPAASSFASQLFIGAYSEGRNFGPTSFDLIDCDAGSNFSCDGSETKTGSTCGLCP